MKRFTVACNFDGVAHPFHIYVGTPCPNCHPLKYQANWLQKVRVGVIPVEVMDSFERLQKIAIENSVSFEDLCVYALGTVSEEGASSSSETG